MEVELALISLNILYFILSFLGCSGMNSSSDFVDFIGSLP